MSRIKSKTRASRSTADSLELPTHPSIDTIPAENGHGKLSSLKKRVLVFSDSTLSRRPCRTPSPMRNILFIDRIGRGSNYITFARKTAAFYRVKMENGSFVYPHGLLVEKPIDDPSFRRKTRAPISFFKIKHLGGPTGQSETTGLQGRRNR